MQITDDLNRLLDIVPDEIRQPLEQHPQRNNLIEIVMDLGRLPEARFPSVGSFGGDNRAGIEQTLHRISAIRNRSGEIIGLTLRVGRAVFGTIGIIRDLVETGQSILMLGRPGVGKTTALREIARVLADDLDKRVVIIDTSNEIAGDGDIPHPAIGRARRMQVSRPELQHQVMIEAVENHMPQVIVIDEIGTELEALAARTIAERGVQLVGTAHGNRLENLMKNPTLADLIGGIQAVTLGDDEARRRGSQKTVLERKSPPTFEIAVEMLERQRWVIHERVSDSIDTLLRGREPNQQIRSVSDSGEVIIERESAAPPARFPGMPASGSGSAAVSGMRPVTPISGWRSAGKMVPMPPPGEKFAAATAANSAPVTEARYFEQLLEESLSVEPVPQQRGRYSQNVGPNGEDLPLHVYPYGIARHQLEQVISTLNLPVQLTKDIESADVVLALRSNVRNQSKLRHLAKTRQVPLHTIKAGTIPHVARALRRLLDMDDPGTPEVADLALFARSGNSDELEALEETRLAVEQIVIPKGQPVELLPRSPNVRKMQHELVEHYHLKSHSFGEEPNRRLRIFPA
ncbi:MAG: AAA family ATPase [Oscillatoriales cyanobacterium]|nr:MAG: AAA family ATPase [Oscillatoriales cyanobacterium]